MQARVHNEAARTECNRLQIPQPTNRIVLVDTQLVGELLRIERPPFSVGIEREQRAGQRKFERVFTLPNVAGNGFVIGERRQTEARMSARRVEVDPEAAGYLAINGARTTVGAGSPGLDLRWQALDFQLFRHESCER